MTGQEVEPYARPAVDSWIPVLDPVGNLARAIAPTEFVPAAMRGKPAAVAAAILTGRELNLPPLTALRGIHIIDGRPSLSAELLAAKILAAGHRIEWQESSDKSAKVRIARADGLSEATAEWTMRDAERAGLTRKPNWAKYPAAMLRARALTEAARMACPDVALGLDTDMAPEPGAPVPAGPTVRVQVARETREDAPQAVREPDPDPEPSTPVQGVLEPATGEESEDPPGPATPEQVKRIHAMTTEVLRMAGQRMSADQKRAFIVTHAGLNPEEVKSLKELTELEAGYAIASLTQAREMMRREQESQQEGPPF